MEGNTSFTLDELIRYDVFTQKDLIGDISGTASGEAQLEVSEPPPVHPAFGGGPHTPRLPTLLHSLFSLSAHPHPVTPTTLPPTPTPGKSEQDREDVGRHQLCDQALP